MKTSTNSRPRPAAFFVLAAGLVGCGLLTSPGQAGISGVNSALVFETELLSMNLTGGPIPLPIGPSWTPVLSDVGITLSSQRLTNPGPRSFGEACAFSGGISASGPAAAPAAGAAGDKCGIPTPPPINPADLDGEPFYVASFFDVFFDITVTDVDPANNIAGAPHGFSVGFMDNGPAPMQSSYTAIFDASAPNFGLIPPPESAPYIGHFNIEILLHADLNGNGVNDKVKFTLATHTVNGENRSFVILPNGTVLDTFDSEAFLEGALVDEFDDPPFSFTLTGPTTASSTLANEIIPEPSSFALAGLGLCGGCVWVVRRWRR